MNDRSRNEISTPRRIETGSYQWRQVRSHEGRTHRFIATGRTQKECVAEMERKVADWKAGRGGRSVPITFERFALDHFMKEYPAAGEGIGESTVEHYRYLTSIALPHLGDHLLGEVDGAAVATMVSALKAVPRIDAAARQPPQIAGTAGLSRGSILLAMKTVCSLRSWGKKHLAPETTVKDAVAAFLATSRPGRPLAAATRAAYELRLRRYVVPHLGGRPLADLDSDRVLLDLAQKLGREGKGGGTGKAPEFIAYTKDGRPKARWEIRRDQRRSAKNRAPDDRRYGDSMIRKVVVLVVQILNWAQTGHRNRFLTELPEIKIPRTIKRRKERPYTRQEALRLIGAARFQQSQVAYLLALDTGMRLGEILGLHREQINWQTGVLICDRQLDQRSRRGKPVLKVPKHQGDAEWKRIPLSPLLMTALRGLPERGPFLLTNDEGGALSRDWLRQCFYTDIERAGLPRKTFHGNRHAFLTWNANEGVAIAQLQQIAGHKDITTTEGYIDPDLPRLRSLIDDTQLLLTGDAPARAE